MIHRHLKKFLFIKTSIIVICLYAVLNSDTEHEISVEDEKINGSSSTMPTTQTIQDNIIEELLRRRTRIRNTCGNKNTNENKVLTSRYVMVIRRLYIDTRHNITWCPIFKAASSTIMRIYASLSGLLTKERELEVQRGHLQLNQLVRKAFPSVTFLSEVALSTNRMIVVRHPFERLLSAYRDKLEHKENREFYYKKYGQNIVRKFGAKKKDAEPTFVEFLQYVASRHVNVDEHWRPYYKECSPCKFDYHFVLKTEFLNAEMIKVFTELGLSEHLPKTSININPQGHTDIQLTEHYFSQVPRVLLESIYKIYQRDFELFGYSPDMYFNMTY